MIQGVLHSMRTKLSKAQDDISIQLHQYQHLLRQQPYNECTTKGTNQDTHSGTRALCSLHSFQNTPEVIAGVEWQQPKIESMVDQAATSLATDTGVECAMVCNRVAERPWSPVIHSGAQKQLEYVTE